MLPEPVSQAAQVAREAGMEKFGSGRHFGWSRWREFVDDTPEQIEARRCEARWSR